jgi:hypothetical protein
MAPKSGESGQIRTSGEKPPDIRRLRTMAVLILLILTNQGQIRK